MDQKQLLIGLGIAVALFLVYCYMTKGGDKTRRTGTDDEPQRENFTYDQIALNAKNYTFIPSRNCQGCLPAARPDFNSMTCNSGVGAGPLQGMSKEQIEQEIDLHYRKPMEMLEVKDLLPETDVSGLSFGVDPSDDFANKFIWHRTTHARVKRRNWETGSAMIRGDNIIDPGQQSWFQHDKDYRDLTEGFIPKMYSGQIDVADLTYNMYKAV
jgi:hypothetical protein